MLTMALRIARRSARGQPELLDALGDELALRQTELTSRERRMRSWPAKAVEPPACCAACT